jgi:hypothetical protein
MSLALGQTALIHPTLGSGEGDEGEDSAAREGGQGVEDEEVAEVKEVEEAEGAEEGPSLEGALERFASRTDDESSDGEQDGQPAHANRLPRMGSARDRVLGRMSVALSGRSSFIPEGNAV